MNIGEGGIIVMSANEPNEPTTADYTVSGTIGALSEKGWSSDKDITLNNGAIVQLAVWDVENKQYTDTAADIDLTAGVGGSGSLTLAGRGKLIVKQALAHDVASTGGQLAIADFSGFKAETGTVTAYTGYGDSTTDGYATGGQYRVAGAGSTIGSAIIISTNAEGESVEETVSITDGLATVTKSLSSEFFVNTDVIRSNIDEVREGTFFTLATGAKYHTTEVADLGKVTVADDTAAVYLQNADGKDLLKITNVPDATALSVTIGGENNMELTCSDKTYTGNFTVLSGATLKQSGGEAVDTAGAPLYNDAGKNRTITVQNQATFDINGTDACYHVILEGGATLKNSSSELGMDKRNTPIIELKGNATVQADNRFGMLGSGYDSTTLTLNNNTLTKTGLGTFHLNNCIVDAGIIEILAGTVAITEKDGQNSSNGTSNISAATFKVGKSTIGTGDEAQHVQGMLSYNENAKGTLEIGHVIAAGGVVLAGENKEIVLSKLSGVSSATDSYITKVGLGTLRLADDIKISDDITVHANVGTLAIGAVDIATDKTLNITGTATADV
ncbi:MAG: hypothetical protein IKK15_03955, partial [Akkermansia sp.]|nr:hypothetical protein [Akkermansia sp.]